VQPAGQRQARDNASSHQGDVIIVHALLAASRVIDAINTRLGKWVSWLIVLVVLISATNATVRKLFDTSSNAWLELQWIMFSVIFLICSPWTLMSNEHIRIDIVNSMFSKTTRNVIDIVGHVAFLLPLTVVMIVTGWPFFTTSYAIREQSFNAGGLPQWPAKSLVVIGFTLLFFQGISELIKRIAIMRGDMNDPHERVMHPAEAEAERLLADIKPEP
jgi:TRAP-type mannitol/chloroaromatic compound transport system permease small subunit